MSKWTASTVVGLVTLLLSSGTVFAQGPDRVSFGRSIKIDSGTSAGDVTCILCSVYMRGQAAGDVTAIGGSVVLDSGASVGGDATAIGGDIRTQDGTSIGGDATAVGGAVRPRPTSHIGGETTSVEGKGWLLLIFVAPLVIFGMFVALVVWLVHWLRRPPPVAA